MCVKSFIEFSGPCIRSGFHSCLKEHITANGQWSNCMNVSAALQAHEKIGIFRQRLDHAIAEVPKEISQSRL